MPSNLVSDITTVWKAGSWMVFLLGANSVFGYLNIYRGTQGVTALSIRYMMSNSEIYGFLIDSTSYVSLNGGHYYKTCDNSCDNIVIGQPAVSLLLSCW